MIGFCGGRLRCAMLAAGVVAVMSASAFVSGAWGFTEPGLTFDYSDFANCPAALVAACLHSYVTSGSIQMGNVTVPLSVPGITIDMGFGGPGESRCLPFDLAHDAGEEACVISGKHGILNGPAQPLSGGLLGVIGAGPSTAVGAKLEWASSVAADTVFGNNFEGGNEYPTTILNEFNLLYNEGVGLTLNTRIHLLNRLLGSNCYIGTVSNPIVLRLLDSRTSPPPPNKPIAGTVPTLSNSAEGGRITDLNGMVLVDNSFVVPVASGCGASINQIIDKKIGLPSAAGRNTAVIRASGDQAGAGAVKEYGWTDE